MFLKREPTLSKNKQRCLLFSLIVFVSSLYVFYDLCYRNTGITAEAKQSIVIHWLKLNTSLRCYYSVEHDALQSTSNPSFFPGDDAMFFLETSCRGGINSRQACAVESAARLHPGRQINLLFSAPVTKHILNSSILMTLLQLHNVQLARIHIGQYGHGTIVEPILTNHLKDSSHPIEHASDILRILTLHKYGGVYLDTDSILVQNLDALPANWIGKQSVGEIASGAMAFTRDGVGKNLTTEILKELRDTFDPYSWSINGPLAIQRVLNRVCPEMLTNDSSNTDCNGLKIFLPKYFYPIFYTINDRYFKNGSIENLEGSYMHHMWNYLTKDLKIEKGSPYAQLARKFCPSVYNTYSNNFGE